MFATRSLAPFIGYALGAWASSVYVDLTGGQCLLVGGCQAEKVRDFPRNCGILLYSCVLVSRFLSRCKCGVCT